MADIEIVEISYPSGNIQFRYSRYLYADGTKWVRHGLLLAYHENGALATEGRMGFGVIFIQPRNRSWTGHGVRLSGCQARHSDVEISRYFKEL